MDDVVYVVTKRQAKTFAKFIANFKNMLKYMPAKETRNMVKAAEEITKIFSKENVVIDLNVSQMDSLEINKIFNTVKKNGYVVLFLREG